MRSLVDAIASRLLAQCQPCRTHLARNLFTKVPKSAQPWVRTLLRIFYSTRNARKRSYVQLDRGVVVLAAKRPTPGPSAREPDLVQQSSERLRQGPTDRGHLIWTSLALFFRSLTFVRWEV